MSDLAVLDIDLEQDLAAIRERLVRARNAAGLSQAQVARLMGYTKPVMSFLETGRSELTMIHFLRLCHIYGIAPTWALTGINPDFDAGEVIAAFEDRIPKPELDQMLDFLSMLPAKPAGESAR